MKVLPDLAFSVDRNLVVQGKPVWQSGGCSKKTLWECDSRFVPHKQSTSRYKEQISLVHVTNLAFVARNAPGLIQDLGRIKPSQDWTSDSLCCDLALRLRCGYGWSNALSISIPNTYIPQFHWHIHCETRLPLCNLCKALLFLRLQGSNYLRPSTSVRSLCLPIVHSTWLYPREETSR